MPPYVEHVPSATTAAAFGARRSTHSFVVIGWPLDGLTPIPAQWPSPLIFSFGIEPSTMRTNGSSLPASASYQACMDSAPTSYARTGVCATTFGMPGIAPVMMSSRLGLTADVMETESPSQLRPDVIQMTWAVMPSVSC